MTEQISYTKRAAQGISIIFVMNALSNVFGYLVRMILARNLTTAEYGLFFAVFNFVLFFLAFTHLGMGVALAKHIPEFKIKKDGNAIKTSIVSTVTIFLAGAGILSTILFCLSGFLSKTYFNNQDSITIIKILTLYIAMIALSNVVGATFAGFQKFSLVALSDFLKNGTVFLLIIFLFHRGIKPVLVPALGYAGGHLVLFLFYQLPFVLKTFPFSRYRLEHCTAITRKMLKFGLPLVIGGIAVKLIGLIDTMILTKLRAIDEVGIYNVALPSAMLFIHLGLAATTVAMPLVAELKAKNDDKKLSEGLQLLLRYSFVIIIPLILSVFVFSDLFLIRLFGEAYAAGQTTLRILLIGVMFFIIGQINHSILSGLGKTVDISKIIIGAAIVNLVCNILFIPRWGMEGAAVAKSLSYIIIFIASTVTVTRYITVDLARTVWLKQGAVGIIFFAVASYLKDALTLSPWVEVPLCSGAALLVFIFAARILNIIDIGEIKTYMSGLRRKPVQTSPRNKSEDRSR